MTSFNKKLENESVKNSHGLAGGVVNLNSQNLGLRVLGVLNMASTTKATSHFK